MQLIKAGKTTGGHLFFPHGYYSDPQSQSHLEREICTVIADRKCVCTQGGRKDF